MVAQVPGQVGPFQSTEFLVTVGLLMAVLLAGAAVLYATDLWRKRRDRQAGEGVETLSMYRDMFEAGELSEPEYRGIRDRIARSMKAGAGVPTAAELRPAAAGGASGVTPAGPPDTVPPPPDPPGPVS